MTWQDCSACRQRCNPICRRASHLPSRPGKTLPSNSKASLRDQPTNADFQARLVESLLGAANLQKREGETEEAIASFKCAVEVREQMVAANPDDKALAQELAKVKGDLEKLQAAGGA